MLISPLDMLPPLRDVIAHHDLMAKKSLGQHFLCDLNLTRTIAESAGDLTDVNVYEIGPGPGGLTRALLATKAKHVFAVEKDPRFISALQDVVKAGEGRLTLLPGDAMKMDWASVAPAPRAIVANLPYNIGTELLVGWLLTMEMYRSLTLMFQAEVVDRITAKPNSKDYGRLSVLAQFCCKAERALDVPAAAFTPPPRVDSAVVHLTPRAGRPADVSVKILGQVTAAAFGQRRKMLRSSLKPLGGEALLMKANIDPERRAETLSLAEFETLARLVS